MADCIFCKIAKGEIPAEKVYEDEQIIAFNDINPVAPTHVLIIPKEHIPTLDALADDKIELVSRMVQAARKIARERGVHESGYRTLINCNKDAGQEVFHLHLHVIGGRKLGPMA